MAWAGRLGAGPPACTRASPSPLSQNRPPAPPSSSPAPRGRSTASPPPGAATASPNAPTAATRTTVPSAPTASSNATAAAASSCSGAATESPTAPTSPTSATVKVGWSSFPRKRLLGWVQLDLAFSPHTHTHNEPIGSKRSTWSHNSTRNPLVPTTASGSPAALLWPKAALQPQAVPAAGRLTVLISSCSHLSSQPVPLWGQPVHLQEAAVRQLLRLQRRIGRAFLR